jgi:MtN3 and saliva related transmembrane protein
VHDSSSIFVLGLVAGTLTTLSFVPQVLKSWRRRSVADLSSTMLVAFTTGVALWLIYGVLTGDLPVVIANVVTLILAGALVVMKFRFGS